MTPPGFRGNLARRVATALVVLPALLLALFLGPPALAVGIVGAAVAVGLAELFRLMRAREIRPLRRTGFVLAALMFLDVVHPSWYDVPFWPLAALLLLTVTLRRGGSLPDTVPAAAATLLGASYLGALGGTMAALRLLSPVSDGAWRMVLLFAIIMAADTAAFFVGHAVGRRPLALQISPGKTVEGAVGGLVGGVAGALAVRALGLPGLPLAHAVGLGVGVAILGILGDLAESLIKRWAGVKDSGELFPGHGGMLDRIDSLLFGAPVLYYYFLYFR
ncbi:MAG TPA: phosphatidate cytidylyltransferase [Vicinamibacteria bacterium]|nr:phosphatidate cytidylyltransferase [Vicinamibacteria bacterium]